MIQESRPAALSEKITASEDNAETSQCATQRSAPDAIQGKFKLDELIGEGGTGRVFKSWHQDLGKMFAVKVLRSDASTNSRTRQRFTQEANATSQLTHHGLCQIFDHGLTDAGAPYLVMEHLEGEDLRQTIKREGPLQPQRVIDLFVDLCDAVAHAHYKGVIHRDLKPSNIILTEKDGVQRPKIVDFGVAKMLQEKGTEENRVTQTGEIFGSPLYMSPEQCTGKSIDPRSDIYSLGCCMYECLTGQPPHQGDNPVQTILKQINDQPKPFDSSLGIPSGLRKVVLTAMEKDPNMRYQTAQDMYRDLLLVRDNRPPKGPVGAKRRNLFDGLKKSPRSAVIALAALACLSLPVCVLMINSSTKTIPTSDTNKDSSKSRSEEPWSATLREARMLGSYRHYDLADPLFQKALEQTKLAKRTSMARINVLNAYGDFLIDSAQNGKGTWLQARKVYAESASLRPYEHNLERLGMIDYQLNDYPKAEEDYAKALEDCDGKFKRKDGSLGENYPLSDRSNQVELANLLIGQGNTFMKEQKYSQARSAFQRAAKVLESPDDRILAAEALKGLAQTFDKEGNFTQADKSYKQAQELLSKLSHSYAQPALVTVLNSRILVLQKLGHEQEVRQLQKQLAELRP